MSELATYLTLLGTAFLAATIIPGSSELVLIGMALDRPEAIVPLFLTATIGNSAGSATNYVLGRWFLRYATRHWFPAAQQQLARAGAWFNRYGAWLLLIAWLPIVGDALTVIAGTVRMNIYAFLALVSVGKAARYAVVLWGTDSYVTVPIVHRTILRENPVLPARLCDGRKATMKWSNCLAAAALVIGVSTAAFASEYKEDEEEEGHIDAPTYRLMLMTADEDAVEAHVQRDLEYVDKMSEHHRGAVRMSEAYVKDPNGTSPFLRRMANAIIHNQRFEISDDRRLRAVDLLTPIVTPAVYALGERMDSNANRRSRWRRFHRRSRLPMTQIRHRPVIFPLPLSISSRPREEGNRALGQRPGSRRCRRRRRSTTTARSSFPMFIWGRAAARRNSCSIS